MKRSRKKGRKDSVLMCPPEYYEVKYSINPWMKGQKVDRTKALCQWEKLRKAIEKDGIGCKLLRPRRGLPDMVYTANAGIVHKKKVVLSNFKHKERMGEEKYYEKWFAKKGFEIYELVPRLKFEGRGDCMIHGGRLIGAYGFRSDREAIKVVGKIFGLKTVILKLKDPRFYHLDTCLSIIDPVKGLAIYYPGAFVQKDLEKKIGMRCLPVKEWEAEKFVCNCITIGRKIIIPKEAEDTDIVSRLNKMGYEICPVPMSEFKKAGGTVRCLVLEL